MATLLCSMLLLLNAVSIRVLPAVLTAGNPIRITCSILRRPENRTLVIAVEGYWSSEYQLNGEDSPAIIQKVYEHVPCGVESVSCTLEENTGRDYRAALPVYVSGCEGSRENAR